MRLATVARVTLVSAIVGTTSFCAGVRLGGGYATLASTERPAPEIRPVGRPVTPLARGEAG